MAITYILMESGGKALLIPESRIEKEATRRLASGQSFEIFRAEPMKVQINFTPASGRGAAVATTAGRPARPAKKAGARRAKAAGGRGRVGRPKVNVGTCTVEGCGRPQKTKGLCSAHYQQHRRLERQRVEGGQSPTPRRKAAGKKTASKAAKKQGARKAKAAGRTAKAASPGRKPARKRAAKAGRKPGRRAAPQPATEATPSE